MLRLIRIAAVLAAERISYPKRRCVVNRHVLAHVTFWRRSRTCGKDVYPGGKGICRREKGFPPGYRRFPRAYAVLVRPPCAHAAGFLCPRRLCARSSLDLRRSITGMDGHRPGQCRPSHYLAVKFNLPSPPTLPITGTRQTNFSFRSRTSSFLFTAPRWGLAGAVSGSAACKIRCYSWPWTLLSVRTRAWAHF